MATQPKRVRLGFLLGTSAIAAAALSAGLTLIEPARTPGVAWRFGPDAETVDPFDKVHAWDEMTVTVDLPFDAYVYVCSFDHFNGSVAYFPTEYLGTDHFDSKSQRMNFLRAGVHDIPGTWDGKPVRWFVPDIRESLSLCVVISRRPLTDLEDTIRLMKQVGNRAFPDRSVGYYMPRAGRARRVGSRRMPHELLETALHQKTIGPRSARSATDGVFLATMHVLPSTARPGKQPPSNPFSRQLEQQVEAKQDK